MNTTIKNNILTVEISDRGAELMSIRSQKEFLWQGIEEIWSGRSPLLFPIVGRLKEDKLKYDGKTYILTKHGFAIDSIFKVAETAENKAVFVLTESEETLKTFPFKFELKVIYQLCGNKLSVTYEMLNTDNDKIYFTIGGHPGFNCKMGDALEFEKDETVSRLVMNNESYICEIRPFLNNENKILITEDLFSEDALIFKGLKSKYITLKTGAADIKVTYGDAPYLGIWAREGAPYVCIEPWFSSDDSIDADYTFDKKDGIIELKVNEKFSYTFDIEINQK